MYSSYTLGLLWSDGYLRKRSNRNHYEIIIECITDDMDEFSLVLDKTYKWNYYSRCRPDRKPITRASFSDKKLNLYLLDKDYDNKSFKSPNKILSTIPKELIKYFILGVIDGDGCFYFNKKYGSRQFTITGTLNQDWSSFEEIFNNLEVTYKILRFPSNKTGYSQIRILNRKNIKKLGDYIYSDRDINSIGLLRKYEKYLSIIQ